MYLGIGCIVLGVIIFVLGLIWSSIKKDYSLGGFVGWMIFLVLAVVGGIFISSPCGTLDYKIAPYSADTGDGRIFFKSYEREGNDLIVPAYYYTKVSWLNTWEYCDSSIAVDVPDGQEIIVVDHTPIPVSRIVGGCK
jgi:hypothetical protein